MAIVELGGVKVTTLLADCEPNEVGIGDEVEAVFRRINEDGKSGIIHYGTIFRPARKVMKVDEMNNRIEQPLFEQNRNK